jgi:hypothetical protein
MISQGDGSPSPALWAGGEHRKSGSVTSPFRQILGKAAFSQWPTSLRRSPPSSRFWVGDEQVRRSARSGAEDSDAEFHDPFSGQING